MISRFPSGDLEFKLMVAEETAFDFAPAYTAWVPDETSSFEWMMRKARNLRIETDTWRFVRMIDEKGKPSVMGRKFSFIAFGNLLRFLDPKRELRFTYDAYQQKAVIKGTGRASSARGGGNCSEDLCDIKLIFSLRQAAELDPLPTHKSWKILKISSMLGCVRKMTTDTHEWNNKFSLIALLSLYSASSLLVQQITFIKIKSCIKIFFEISTTNPIVMVLKAHIIKNE